MATPEQGVEAPPDTRAVDGRVPGRRGRATRERLLLCTADLLEKTSYRDLTVIDIATCAGTSPATFYQYFEDVEAAVLVLAQAMADEGAQLTELIQGSDWRGRDGYDSALALVDAFFDLWEQHRPVMRVVDLSVAEGDLRFQNIRTHLLNQVTEAMRNLIEGFKRQGKHPERIDAMAQAAALVSMLAHVAAHKYGYEFWGIRTGLMRESVARIVASGVTGQQPTG